MVRHLATVSACLVLAACAGKPLAPPDPAAVSGSVSAKLKHVVNLAGVARVPARLLGDAGAGIISEHGGALIGKVKLHLLAKEALVPVPRARVTAVDGAGAPVAGVSATTTDDVGAYTLRNVPVGALVEIRVETAGLAVATLARPSGNPAPANLTPATTLVTASLRRGLADLGQLPIPRFDELVGVVDTTLETHDVALDLSTPAGAAASYDRVVAVAPQVKEKEAQAEQETVAAATPAPGGGQPVLVTPGPTPTPEPTPFEPGPTPTPGATPTPAPTPTPGGVTTLAGSTAGYQDGPAPLFSGPAGVALAPDGTLYVADTANHVIRKIAADGTASTFAGSAGNAGYANGTGTAARFNQPRGLSYDPGNQVLVVADTGNHVIRFISSAGQVGDLAGPQAPTVASGFLDGTQVNARFNGPTAVAFASSTQLFVADTGNNCIRRIDVNGATIAISTYAGAQTPGLVEGAGATARFSGPTGVAVGGAGEVYVADAGNGRIREIDPTGVVSTFASGITARNLATRPNGTLVVSSGSQLLNFSATGVSTPLAGAGAGFLDGLLSAALFSSPDGLAATNAVTYVADVGNHRIRKVAP